MRQFMGVEGIGKLFGLSKWQVYALMRRSEDPLPAKRIGKLLRVDVEKAFEWFDRQRDARSR